MQVRLVAPMFVKLIAKPNTWFKEGTEAYHYYDDRRLTEEEWAEMVKDGMYCLRGTWIAKKGYGAVENCGFVEGQEYQDGECGNTDEFVVELVDSPR